MDTKGGPALLFVVTDCDPALEEAWNRRYDERHLPQRRALPGWLSAQRYAALPGAKPAGIEAGQALQPKYMTLYDLVSPMALESDEYRALRREPIETEEDRRMLAAFRNHLRAVMVRVAAAEAQTAPPSQQAAALRVASMEPDPAYEEEYNAWYDEEPIPNLLRAPGVLRMRRFKAVEGSPGYVAIWELADAAAGKTAEFRGLGVTPWTRRMLRHSTLRVLGNYPSAPRQPGAGGFEGDVLPDSRRRLRVPAGAEATPVDLGRRPHRGGAAAGSAARRRQDAHGNRRSRERWRGLLRPSRAGRLENRGPPATARAGALPHR